MGAMIGAYVPLNRYARDNDCYSKFWQVGAQVVEYSQLADGGDISNGKKAVIGINLIQDSLALTGAIGVCLNQYKVER